jgi:hypothetical protein
MGRRVTAVRAAVLCGAAIVVAVLAGIAAAGPLFTGWAAAQKIDDVAGNSTELNTTSLDGCPIQSPDGLSLYIASNRPGGLGGLDIWVAQRASTSEPFGVPVNLGEPVNSAADDFCPTPVRGKGLFFVSREALPGACGQGDIYFTRKNPAHGWAEPERLACAPVGPNSDLDEQGPSKVEAGGRELLYFSRSSASVPGDIYVSEKQGEDGFGPAVAVTELNNATATDIQPNVRKDGREVVFSSNRTGTFGGQDIWVATRDGVDDPWSGPINLGEAVNKAAGESGPRSHGTPSNSCSGARPGPRA